MIDANMPLVRSSRTSAEPLEHKDNEPINCKNWPNKSISGTHLELCKELWEAYEKHLGQPEGVVFVVGMFEATIFLDG